MVKVVIVSTSATELEGHPTGLWLEERAAAYYTFLETSYEIVLASPAGGPVPIDQACMAEGFFTDACKKSMHDPTAIGKLSHTVKLDAIDFKTDVDAIFLTGGHGTCTDFVSCPSLKTAVETLYAADKIVSAAVCHGPVGLVDCCKPDGSALVAGKR
jgi:putative intracellular protease/amidase